MQFDENKMYRCDTPVIFKITDFNTFDPTFRSEERMLLKDVQSRVHLWSATYGLLEWKFRRKIKWWLVPCKNINYKEYELEEGQLCPCNIHKVA